MRRAQRWLLLLAISVVGACGSDDDERMVGTDFEASWHPESDLHITKALFSNRVRECGEYKYKRSLRVAGEYAVYCTLDGVTWNLYLVEVASARVQGPYPTEPSLN